jgi:hypothetical protein
MKKDNVPNSVDESPPSQAARKTYATAIRSLVASVSGIRSCQSVAGEAVGKVAEQRWTELFGIADDVEEKGNKYILKVKDSNHYKLNKMMRAAQKDSEAIVRLNTALFTDLITVWDTFFARLVSLLLEDNPNKIDESKRQMTFSDLKRFESVEAARDFIRNQEIEDLMRKSHTEQFKYLEGFGFKQPPEDMWATFIELTERRNLVVHTGLVVSQQYINICQEHNVKTKAELGKRLGLSGSYIPHACDFIIELGAKLGQTIWRVTRKNEHDRQDSEFIKLTYGLLEDEEYELARRILDFGLSPPMRFAKPIDRMLSVVNLAQAYKWLGQQEKCLETLKQIDFSIVSEQFRLADYVLRDDFDNAATLMRRMGDKGPVTKEDFQSWPLFQQFRATPVFSSVSTDLFPPRTETKEIPKAVGGIESKIVGNETSGEGVIFPHSSSTASAKNELVPPEVE